MVEEIHLLKLKQKQNSTDVMSCQHIIVILVKQIQSNYNYHKYICINKHIQHKTCTAYLYLFLLLG